MKHVHRMCFSIAIIALVSWYFFTNAGVFLASPAGKPEFADVLVILGGDAGARTIRGLELYRKKYATRIFLTSLEYDELDARNYYLHWRSRLLLDGGVKRDAIEFDTISKNSWEEAENTLKLAKQHGWTKIIVVSDPPHMRRLKWVWSKVLKDSGVDFVLVSGTPSWWRADKWWTNELSAKFVVNEYIKIVYYFFRH